MADSLEYFNKLSWWLLEAKIIYYLIPEQCYVSDAEYDRLEKVYINMCKKLGLPNTIQSMIGIDENRPSVQNALYKLRMNGWKMISL